MGKGRDAVNSWANEARPHPPRRRPAMRKTERAWRVRGVTNRMSEGRDKEKERALVLEC